MKSVTSLLLVLSLSLSPALSRVARADAFDAAAPARSRLRREKVATLSLVATIVGLELSGGALLAEGHGYDYLTGTGFAFTISGAILTLPALELGLYTAGHEAGLKQLPGFVAAAPAQREALVDGAEANARREEITGITLFLTGLALFAGGIGMVAGGLSGFQYAPEGGTSSGGNGPLFVAGVTTSVLGDALWFSGTLVWSHGAGKHRGIRDARAALAVTPMGIAGSF